MNRKHRFANRGRESAWLSRFSVCHEQVSLNYYFIFVSSYPTSFRHVPYCAKHGIVKPISFFFLVQLFIVSRHVPIWANLEYKHVFHFKYSYYFSHVPHCAKMCFINIYYLDPAYHQVQTSSGASVGRSSPIFWSHKYFKSFEKTYISIISNKKINFLNAILL